MRGRMTQHVEAFKRFRQHRLDLYRITVLLLVQSESEIDFPAIDARGQRLLSRVTVELL